MNQSEFGNEPMEYGGQKPAGPSVLLILGGSLAISAVLLLIAAVWYFTSGDAPDIAQSLPVSPTAPPTTSSSTTDAQTAAPPSTSDTAKLQSSKTGPVASSLAPEKSPPTAPSPSVVSQPVQTAPSPSANPASENPSASAQPTATTEPTSFPPDRAATAEPSDPPTGSDNSDAATAAEGTKAVPSDEELAKARADIVEIFGAQARQATKPEQKREVAEKMLSFVEDAKGEPAAQFVLLENATKLLIGAGEVELAATAVETLCEHFTLDAWQRRTEAMTGLADAGLTPEQRESLVTHLLEQIDQAVAERKFEAADKLSLLAVKAGARLKNIDLRKQAVQRRSEIQQLVEQLDGVEKARATLVKSPDDPDANLAIGKFLCFSLEDWKEGIAHLAKASDTALAAPAKADQAAAADAKSVLAAADAWYQLAEESKSDKELSKAARRRARHWYEQVKGSVTGLELVRVEKRLESLSDAQPVAKSSAAPAGGKTTKRKVKPQAVSGLVGRVLVNNRDTGVVVRYRPGHFITRDELLDLQRQIGVGERDQTVIEFAGLMTMTVDGSVQVRHVGGSANRGVHRLMVDGRPISEVGDDRTKDTRDEFALAKGDHPIRWSLSGGDLGTAQLEFSLTKPNPPNEGVLKIHVPKELMAVALSSGVTKEIEFGKAEQ